ncbi:hypothetical protein NT239_07530 [Chitinibacter sp. SCUT-21]|uniref:hypothetical protein n=1 Tax=Chitinibacter sp. SCUT-21 TaxID=2970891 RepID=UPI0035A620B2
MIRLVLCGLLCVPTAWADDWGSLFFTREQRATGSTRVAASAAAESPAPQTDSTPQLYNGLIQTPRQKTHWVDGKVAPAPKAAKPGEQFMSPGK